MGNLNDLPMSYVFYILAPRILSFCMYFDMYPKGVTDIRMHFGYMSDTSRVQDFKRLDRL